MDWFRKLFIDEAKPALERHSGSGGSGGGSSIEVCDVEFYSESSADVNVVFVYFDSGIMYSTTRSYTGGAEDTFTNVVCNSIMVVDTSSDPMAIPYTYDNITEIFCNTGYSVYEVTGNASIEVIANHLGGGPGG